MTNPTALPKYVQIAETLIRDMAAGRLIAGERLPPERRMADDMGIAVGTLRKALSDLADRGLLERIQGSGNYVKSGADTSGIYAFFRLELVGGGGLPTAEVISVATRDKPAGLPAFGTSDHAHRIRRLRRLSGTPAAVEEIWLDGGFARSLRVEELSESLYLYYRKRLGLWIARAEDQVGVSTVPDWAGPPFALAPGTTCGYVERIARADTGKSAEFSRTWFDPQRARYVARLK